MPRQQSAKSQTSTKTKPLLEKPKVQSPKSKNSSKSKKEDASVFALSEIMESSKPKKASSAWMFFVRSIFEKRDGSESPAKVTTITTQASEKWKAMSDEEKHPFKMLAEADQKRHQREMQEFEKNGYFVNQDGVKSTDASVLLVKPKFKDHVVTPKSAKTPYVIYFSAKMECFKKETPKDSKLVVTDLTRKIAATWKELSDTKKKPFVKLAEKDRERFDREFNQLISQGYFITQDGQKSTDLKKKVKRVKPEESKVQIGSKRAKPESADLPVQPPLEKKLKK